MAAPECNFTGKHIQILGNETSPDPVQLVLRQTLIRLSSIRFPSLHKKRLECTRTNCFRKQTFSKRTRLNRCESAPERFCRKLPTPLSMRHSSKPFFRRFPDTLPISLFLFKKRLWLFSEVLHVFKDPCFVLTLYSSMPNTKCQYSTTSIAETSCFSFINTFISAIFRHILSYFY